jgi:hypothetical protein
VLGLVIEEAVEVAQYFRRELDPWHAVCQRLTPRAAGLRTLAPRARASR